MSQAHLWATGRMREELRLAGEFEPLVPAVALVPLGYNLAADGHTIVPIYAAGLPLVMAVFERVAGRDAVFWVPHLLAGVAVWFTFLWGRRAAGPVAGVVAAALLAASPAFVLQLTAAPMSDLPATAWWTLALALLFVERWWAVPIAGLGAVLAILTRPNLVPVAVVPLLFLGWRAIGERRQAAAAAAPGAAARPRRRDLLVYSSGVTALPRGRRHQPSSLRIAALVRVRRGRALRARARGSEPRELSSVAHRDGDAGPSGSRSSRRGCCVAGPPHPNRGWASASRWYPRWWR